MIKWVTKIFNRGDLKSDSEIIKWWEKGRGILNVSLLIYTLIYLSLIVLVFKNGWIVFLFPIIFALFIIVNLIYSFGLLIELASVKLFKLKIDFNKTAPEIKKIEIVLIIVLVFSLSLYDIHNQW
jgi:hypothetical protein